MGGGAGEKEEVLWSALMEDFLLLVSQTRHVTRPDKEEREEEYRERQRREGRGGQTQ